MNGDGLLDLVLGSSNGKIACENQANTELEIYDLNGRLLCTLNPGVLSSGAHLLEMDISALSQGAVFLVCTAGAVRLIEPVVILR